MQKPEKNKVMKKIVFILVFFIISYIFFPVFIEFYGKFGARKFAEEFSPGKRYKVEYYILSDYKSILFSVDDPFFIKVYDFQKKNYVFESNIHSMLEITGLSWPRKGLPNIIVGTGIITHDLELEEYHAIP
jgi:hypothetical protein